jgi:hypothetical protein
VIAIEIRRAAKCLAAIAAEVMAVIHRRSAARRERGEITVQRKLAEIGWPSTTWSSSSRTFSSAECWRRVRVPVYANYATLGELPRGNNPSCKSNIPKTNKILS